jgi:small neutral amino acid transporter SnatA (MarC family)
VEHALWYCPAMPWLFVFAGLFSLAGAVFNWNFFMNHRKAQSVARLLGRNGTRVFYALLGLVIAGVGAAMAAGVIPAD